MASISYAALRHGGTPPGAARVQLGLGTAVAARLERLFQQRGGGGADAMRPRFARHAEHVRAVMAQGGYPALPDRPR
ncbi:hypothetical protein DJ021_14080 [Phenylobacterium hankyongense]|uniref:Uncharacterized protein n=1 Tax=Phenylobacterium hankyongense TaxID=1813876 RepID=A0A328B224_9CAUL|nr:hypothetical protein [Phenylobacterium hankyongense]RAK60857.1 hypothetical protein DJ021_14080 [Phenylobacterium hankyongense]